MGNDANLLGTNKQMKNVLKAVRRAGWRYEASTHGVKVFPPNGDRPIPLHRSKGKGHGTSNAIAQLRKAGLNV